MPDDKDARVTCAQCAHYVAGSCANARQAQLGDRQREQIGRDFATLLQNCNGYRDKK